jgi:hypothetical protein
MDEQAVDVAAWIARFPLDIYLPKTRTLDAIVSAFDWAMIEQIRDRTSRLSPLGNSRPTDSLVFISGEAPERRMTKLGGAPYRPATLPWPCREDGVHMTFVAQFSFVQSKDVVPDLPGDVLLIFARDNDLYVGDPPYWYFEWQPGGLTNLIEPRNVPPPAWIFARAYAVRHRTVDYEDEAKVVEQAKWVCEMARMHPYRLRMMLRSIARLPSAKIGGLPHWCRPEQHGGEEAGPILCALGDVTAATSIDPPPPEVDWWAETDEPWEDDEEDYLAWRDGCQINFFLKDDGEIHWNVDFG